MSPTAVDTVCSSPGSDHLYSISPAAPTLTLCTGPSVHLKSDPNGQCPSSRLPQSIHHRRAAKLCKIASQTNCLSLIVFAPKKTELFWSNYAITWSHAVHVSHHQQHKH